jgi:hypothetical protein
MPDIQTVTYPNGKQLLVACSNKSGSSTAITMIGYPLMGVFKYRDDRLPLIKSGVWKERNIRGIAPTEWENIPVRIAIIRDPVKRFVSSYRDRVLNKNKDKVKSFVTDFDYYVNNIDEVRFKSKDIRNHTKTQVSSIGNDPSKYTHIILTDNMNTELIPLIEQVSEVPSVPVSYHKMSKKAPKVIPSNEQVKKIKKLFKEDYDAYGKWFD